MNPDYYGAYERDLTVREALAALVGMFGLLGVLGGLFGNGDELDRGMLLLIAAAVIYAHREIRLGLLGLFGYYYLRRHPDTAYCDKANIDRREIARFVLRRIPDTEVARTHAETAAEYRWLRRVEQRAQIRIGTDAYPATSITGMRILLNATARERGHYPRTPTADQVGDMPEEWLRATVISTGLINARKYHYLFTSIQQSYGGRIDPPVVVDLMDELRFSNRPQDMVGWSLMRRVLIEEDALPAADTLTALRAVSPNRQGMPGWLLYLAGIGATEVLPAGASADGLHLLAALRGHPMNLLDLPTCPEPDLSGRNPILSR